MLLFNACSVSSQKIKLKYHKLDIQLKQKVSGLATLYCTSETVLLTHLCHNLKIMCTITGCSYNKYSSPSRTLLGGGGKKTSKMYFIFILVRRLMELESMFDMIS